MAFLNGDNELLVMLGFPPLEVDAMAGVYNFIADSLCSAIEWLAAGDNDIELSQTIVMLNCTDKLNR